MTTITVADWPARARRLAEKLVADGDLHSPQWKSAVCAVPRHEFIPHYYRHDTSTRPATWQLVAPSDPSEVQAWLDLVYSEYHPDHCGGRLRRAWRADPRLLLV